MSQCCRFLRSCSDAASAACNAASTTAFSLMVPAAHAAQNTRFHAFVRQTTLTAVYCLNHPCFPKSPRPESLTTPASDGKRQTHQPGNRNRPFTASLSPLANHHWQIALGKSTLDKCWPLLHCAPVTVPANDIAW